MSNRMTTFGRKNLELTSTERAFLDDIVSVYKKYGLKLGGCNIEWVHIRKMQEMDYNLAYTPDADGCIDFWIKEVPE